MPEVIMWFVACSCCNTVPGAVFISSLSRIGEAETKAPAAKTAKIRLKCIVMLFLYWIVVDVLNWILGGDEQNPGVEGLIYRLRRTLPSFSSWFEAALSPNDQGALHDVLANSFDLDQREDSIIRIHWHSGQAGDGPLSMDCRLM
jgi:hypothetical protein